jgi:putative ABC transport system permease protein
MSVLASLRERLRALLFWSREDHEMDEELAFHLELERDRLIGSGVPPEDARRQAAARFGSVQQCREAVRDERGLLLIEHLRRDVLHTLTSFRRRPAAGTLVVLTLAIGLAAATTVVSLVHGVLLTPPPYSEPNRIVLASAVPTGDAANTGAIDWAATDWLRWQSDARSFEAVAAHRWSSSFLVSDDGSETIRGMWVSISYFDVIGTKPLLGRTFDTSDTPGAEPVLILGYELWQRRFGGDPTAIGRRVRIGRGDVTVIGIMPPGIRFLPSPSATREPNYDVDAMVDYWVPALPAAIAQRTGLDRRIWNVVGRLRRGTTAAQAETELRQLQAGASRTAVPRLDALTAVLNAEAEELLVPLSVGAGLLLLIACGNAAALLLIRGLQRQQEFAVRTALGAGRLAIVRQIGIESLLLAEAGGLIGSLMAASAVAVVQAFGGDAVPRADAARVGWTMVAWGLAAAVVAAVLAGLLPALRAARLDQHAAVKNADLRSTVGPQERRLLGGIVLVQSALTLLLLVGAGLLVRTMYNVSQVRSGYQSTGVITMAVTSLSTDWLNFHQRALQQVAAAPGVDAAALAWGVPLTGDNWQRDFAIDGVEARGDEPITLPLRATTPGYFALLGIPLVSGRDFDAGDQANAPLVAIVNQALVDRYFRNLNPLGRTLRSVGPQVQTARIVGVVADLRTADLTASPEPEVYFPLWQSHADTKHLIVRTTAEAAAVSRDVQRVLRTIDPMVALEDVRTLDEIRDASVARRRVAAGAMIGFAAAATLLTAFGIYGVVSLWVEARHRELAIRLAIGADRWAVLRMVVREGAQLVTGGVALGLTLALAVSGTLQSLLFEVRPNDPLTMLTAGVAFLAGALCCCLVPALRASRVNPLEALRQA